MLPHFALLFLTTGLVSAAASPRASLGLRRLAWIVVACGLVLFGGLRDFSVGVDTMAYVSRFDYMQASEQIWDQYGSFEAGIKLIYATALILGETPKSFLILSSLVAVVFYIYGIQRNSENPALSLYLFIAFGFYAFHLNGLRQGIALGIYLLAIPNINSGNFQRYAIWVIVASLFHVSAIISLPLYFLFRLRISVFSISLLVVSSVASIIFLEKIFILLSLVNPRFLTYGERTETGAVLLTVYYTAMSVFFIFARSVVPSFRRKEYDVHLLMLVFGSLIFVLVQITSSYVEMTRMALYFNVTMVFLWPQLLASLHDPRTRLVLIVGLMMAGCIFYYVFLNQIGGYIPYEFG